MPRFVEDIVACHHEASKRRRAGLPIWDNTIPLRTILKSYEAFGDDLTPSQAAEACQRISTQLKAYLPPAWFERKNKNFDEEFNELVEHLGTATEETFAGSREDAPVDLLDNLLEQLYDWADRQRVWLGAEATAETTTPRMRG